MDIPFQTIRDTTNYNSTTSALFYGLKNDSSNSSSYAGSEADFTQTKLAGLGNPAFLCVMLTAPSLSEAKFLVDQGVNSDGSFSSKPVVLAKSSDPLRNIRSPLFDNTIFNSHILGAPFILRTNSDTPSGQTNLFGYSTGLASYSVSPNSFVPGAIADSLTSFGGIIFGANDQTNLLAFIKAGATGSYGTVAEPMADVQKFPDPQVYFYQARGFNLAESYYQSVAVPYLGLIVAEPLAAPFAHPGSAVWTGSISNSILSQTTSLHLRISAAGANQPLQQVDLFVDGKYFRTVTNLPPTPGNVVTLSLNGYPYTYIVPTNATLGSIASNLTALINNPGATNDTKIRALLRGDRIEMQSFATNHSSFPFFAANVVAPTAPGITYRTTYLPDSSPPRLTTQSPASDNRFRMQMEIPTPLKYTIEASTNLTQWQPIFTNLLSGRIDFTDPDSTNYSRRFYRIRGPVPNQPPKISLTGVTNGTSISLRLESLEGQPSAIVASTNQSDWSGMITNLAGGVLDLVDGAAASFSQRFYRAWLLPAPSPSLTPTNLTPATPVVRIDNAVQPYTVELTTNGSDWISMTTNFAFREIQVTTGSSTSNNLPLTTFLNPSRPSFVATSASGSRQYTFLSGTLTAGAWVKFTITKTNGQTVILSATNQTAGISSTNLAYQFFNLINSHSALQGNDGLIGEDYSVIGGQAQFNLRARSPGYPAAQIGVLPKVSGFATGVAVAPGFARYLDQNISDLQPRNHLYVTAGATQLDVDFSLDTTQLPDGYHELTAVAYEGSHVRTQTRATVPVCISNSPLAATLTLLDLTNNAPVNATYRIQVSANTNTVNLTTLYSTGGPLGTATNNPSATFDVIGTNLWAGLHPFYAIVETTTGQKYRTATRWISLK